MSNKPIYRILKSIPAPTDKWQRPALALMRPAYDLAFYLRLPLSPGCRHGLLVATDQARNSTDIAAPAEASVALLQVTVTPIGSPARIVLQTDRTETLLATAHHDGLFWHLAVSEDGADPADSETTAAVPLVFVGGPPKSGTTWVEHILNAHPDALVCGEGNPAAYIAPETIAHAELAGARQTFNPWQPHRRDPRTDGCLANLATVRALIAQPAAMIEARIAGDRSPQNAVAIRELLHVAPAARFVFTLRHPLDVAVSDIFHQIAIYRGNPEIFTGHRMLIPPLAETLARGERLGPGSLDAPELVDTVIDWWCEYACYLAHATTRYPGRVHTVVYERLIDDFEGTTSGLFSFLGLSADAATLARIKAATRFEAFSDARRPGEEDPASFFRSGTSGNHRRYLSPSFAARCLDRLPEAMRGACARLAVSSGLAVAPADVAAAVADLGLGA